MAVIATTVALQFMSLPHLDILFEGKCSELQLLQLNILVVMPGASDWRCDRLNTCKLHA